LDLYINGNLIKDDKINDCRRLGEMISQLDENILTEEQMITGVSIDGNPMEDPLEAEHLDISEVAEIHVSTEHRTEICKAILREVKERFDPLQESLQTTAERLAEGSSNEGLMELAGSFDVWDAVRQGIFTVVALMGLEVEAMTVADRSYMDEDAELVELLQQIRDAISSNDLVSVGDLAEYELAPHVDTMRELVNILEKHVGGSD